MAVDGAGAIYVADEQGSHRVQKFAASVDALIAGLAEHAAAALAAAAGRSDGSVGHEASGAGNAIEALEAFIDRVEAQRGIRLADTQADFLVAAARVMIASLGG